MMNPAINPASLFAENSATAVDSTGLPALPLEKEVAWASVHWNALPPTDCMPPRQTISDRLKLQKQIRQTLKQLQRDSSRVISGQQMSNLGLPELPSSAGKCSSEYEGKDTADKPSRTKRSLRTFSALQYYGVDDSSLNRLLATTAVLIETMPSQSAADCLMDMPSWMRNIYLARHGVPRLVGLMLASRLEDAGEASIIDSDGSVEVHNIPAPERSKLDLGGYCPKIPESGCGLTRLTAGRKFKRSSVVIKNPNDSVTQAPRTSALEYADFHAGSTNV